MSIDYAELTVNALRATNGDGPTRVGRLVVRQLSDVRSRAIRELVPGFLPLRTLTLVAGIGGVAKSMWLAGIAAGVTKGRYGDAPAGVLVVSYEDTAEEIWRPRVLAADGDVERVGYVSVELDEGGIVVLPQDLMEIEAVALEQEVRLIIIDPIVAAFDTALDAYKDQHVRSVLGRLATLAENIDGAIAGLAHLNKTPSREHYVRVANSVAFWNASRSVVLITNDELEDDRIVAQVKANWLRVRPIERWRIEGIVLPNEIDPITGQPIETARMVFLEQAPDVDPVMLLERENREPSKIEQAVAFLEAALADGEWHEKAGLVKLSGVNERTLERAADRLSVGRDLRGFPANAWWQAPSSVTTTLITTLVVADENGVTGADATSSDKYIEEGLTQLGEDDDIPF